MRRFLLSAALLSACSFVAMTGTSLASTAQLLGNATVESSSDNNPAGLAEAFRYSASASGSAGSISVYVDQGSAATTLIAGLYSGNRRGPTTLLAAGSLPSPTAAAWNTVNLSSNPALSSGQTYWIALLGTGGQLNFRDLGSGGTKCSQDSAQSSLSSLSAAWSSGVTWVTCSLSAYVSAAGATPPPPPPSAPTNTALPALSGTTTQGQTVSSTPGAWSGSPTSYSYQWQDCASASTNCTNISGATSSSYVLAASDVGDTVRSVVTATNSGGSISASSAVSQTVAAATSGGSSGVLFGNQSIQSTQDSNPAGSAQAFSVTSSSSGTANSVNVYVDPANTATNLFVGLYSNNGGHPGTLLASGSVAPPQAGTWNFVSIPSTPVASGTYWIALLGTGGKLYFRDRSPGTCNSENSSQTTLSALTSTWSTGPVWSDGSCPVSVNVSGSTGTGGTGSPPPPSAPSPTAMPQISGTTTQGDPVATSNGSWSGSPTGYTYQWQDCNASGASCTNISGATASSHMLTSGDVGDTLRSVVTATNSGGSTPATSAPSAVVSAPVSSPPAAAPANTVLPTVSGTTTQGDALTTSNGSWSGSPTGYTYQWQDCNASGASCTNISGATGSSYTLTSGDVGNTLRAAVTATNAGGSTPATSAQSAVVAAPAPPPPPPPAAPSNTALPVLSGSTVQGSAVSTTNGSWSGSPTSYAYQWQDCNSSGASCANISGATGSSYTLTSGDVGDTVRAMVTATNGTGSDQAASATVGPVTSSSPSSGAPANSALPVIYGHSTPGSELFAHYGTWAGNPTSYSYQWQDCNSSGSSCADATMASTGLSGEPCSATTWCYVVSSAEASAGDTLRVIVTATNSSGSAAATAGSVGPASNSAPVNCALTHAAGTDTGGDHNDGSCWGQQTGITGATGCTEAQIVAQSPAQCGPPYITHITGDQSYNTANQVIANAYITGCVAVQQAASNFHMRDVLIYTNHQGCANSGSTSDSQGGAWQDGNTTNVPSKVYVEDTEIDGLDIGVESDPVLNSFGMILGAGGTCLRCNVHGFAKLLTVNGTSSAPTTVQDTFLHDLNQTHNDSYDCTTAGGDHYDAHENAVWGDSASYVTIGHSYASGVGAGDCLTSPMTFLSDWGAPTHDTIQSTYMEGGGAPGGGRPDAYFGKSGLCGSSITVTNNAFSNNTMSGNMVLEWSSSNSGNSWSNNSIAETGQTLAASNNC